MVGRLHDCTGRLGGMLAHKKATRNETNNNIQTIIAFRGTKQCKSRCMDCLSLLPRGPPTLSGVYTTPWETLPMSGRMCVCTLGSWPSFPRVSEGQIQKCAQTVRGPSGNKMTTQHGSCDRRTLRNPVFGYDNKFDLRVEVRLSLLWAPRLASPRETDSVDGGSCCL